MAVFSQYRYIKSPDAALAWIKAIAEAEGIVDVLWYPDDVAEAVASFASRGVHVTPGQAQAVFSVYAEKDMASWVGVPADAIAGLDWIVEEIIEQTSQNMPRAVAALRDHLPA